MCWPHCWANDAAVDARCSPKVSLKQCFLGRGGDVAIFLHKLFQRPWKMHLCPCRLLGAGCVQACWQCCADSAGVRLAAYSCNVTKMW